MKLQTILNTVILILQLIINKIKKVRRQPHKNAECNIEQDLVETPNKAAAVGPPTTHHENYPS